MAQHLLNSRRNAEYTRTKVLTVQYFDPSHPCRRSDVMHIFTRVILQGSYSPSPFFFARIALEPSNSFDSDSLFRSFHRGLLFIFPEITCFCIHNLTSQPLLRDSAVDGSRFRHVNNATALFRWAGGKVHLYCTVPIKQIRFSTVAPECGTKIVR